MLGSVGTETSTRESSKTQMQILYDSRTDLLYLRLDDRQQELVNKRLSEDVVLDLGEENMIVGIEIMDASKRVNLARLLPVEYGSPPERA